MPNNSIKFTCSIVLKIKRIEKKVDRINPPIKYKGKKHPIKSKVKETSQYAGRKRS